MKILKPPDALLTSDWHIRHDTPVCRTDDFQKSMWAKVAWVREQQKKYKCPVLHAGDLFNKWRHPHWLVSKTIENIPNDFWTVFGNHELPGHNLGNMDQSALWTLFVGEHVGLLKGHYGDKKPVGMEIKGRQILLMHTYAFVGKEPFPGAKGKARNILHKYSYYDLIVTGDNHQSFTYPFDGRLLVNPGSLMRQEAGQIDFEPKVYFWYADTNTAIPVIVPHEKGVVTREHLDKKENKLNRIDAFIEKLDTDWEGTVSFDKNIELFLSRNRIRKQVKEIVNEMMD